MGWLAGGIILAYVTGFVVWIAESVHGTGANAQVDSLPIILFFVLAAPLGFFLGWLINQ